MLATAVSQATCSNAELRATGYSDVTLWFPTRRISQAAPVAFFGRNVRAYLLKSLFAHIRQTDCPLPPSLRLLIWGVFSGKFVFQSKSQRLSSIL